MPTYTAPTRDFDYLLHDVLAISAMKTPGYDELERDFTSAVLEEAGETRQEIHDPCSLGSGSARGNDRGAVYLTGSGWTTGRFKRRGQVASPATSRAVRW